MAQTRIPKEQLDSSLITANDTAAAANALNSATTTINVNGATAPVAGQVLTAVNSTSANWQTPSGGGGSSAVTTKIIAGRSIPVASPAGETLDMPLQQHMSFRRWGRITALVGNSILAYSGFFSQGTHSVAGTGAAGALSVGSVTNLLSAQSRIVYTSAATANTNIGISSGVTYPFYRSATPNGGGFLTSFLFGISQFNATGRIYIGINNSGTMSTISEPSTDANCIMLGKDSGDTTLQWMSNDGVGTCTKESLGISYDSAAVYRLVIAGKPNSLTVDATLYVSTRTTTNTYNKTFTTNVPGTGLQLANVFLVNTGTTATAIKFDILDLYSEIDF